MAAESARPVALVTGASAGIGRDLAEVCARDGHDLVLVARRADALLELAKSLEAAYGVSARVFVADLTQPEAPARIVEDLERSKTAVDVLINNAGSGQYGLFQHTAVAEELDTIQINVAALTHLTKLLLPGMLARHRGRILNVASTAAFQPGPLMAVYYASKAYVLHFSEALANELHGTGVTVTALCPGPTRTGFQARAGMNNMLLTSGSMMMESAAVARAGYEGMRRGRRVVIPGLLNKLLTLSVRISPRRLTAAIVRRIQEKRT